MSDDLYNDAIVKAARAGARGERLPEPRVSVTRDNPLCGDRVTVDVRAGRGPGGRRRPEDARLHADPGRGLPDRGPCCGRHGRRARGSSEQEVKALLAGTPGTPSWPELEMFRPVSGVKSRHECVLLPFEALRAALDEGAHGSGKEQGT